MLRGRFLLAVGLALLFIACQVIPTPPPLKLTPPGEVIRATSTSTRPVNEPPVLAPTGTPQSTSADLTGGLPPFPRSAEDGFSPLEEVTWESAPYAGERLQLPYSLNDVVNRRVIEGLTLSQRDFLERNGFVVVSSQETQFSDLRARVALHYGQPYYLGTDAAYHALYTNFNELVLALEREELYARMLAITQAVYQELISYLPLVHDTELQEDALLAAAYMGVALRLFDPQAELEPGLAPLVEAQVAQVQAAQGRAASTLIPGFQDDFRAYQPVGRYTGDPLLECYYRAMSWYGRVHFPIVGFGVEAPPSRAPLLITLALRQASVSPGESAAEAWQMVNEALTFLEGGALNDGPPEYAALMDQVYGPRVTLISLADEPLWQTFQALAGELPTTGSRASFSALLEQARTERGWRFIGARFDLDAFVFENLVDDRVGSPQDQRVLPSGLDIMAVLGSRPAAQALAGRGDFDFQNYPERLSALEGAIAAQPGEEWLDTAQGTWMYALSDQLSASDAPDERSPYPAYMRAPAWGYRALEGALASWVEWGHNGAVQQVSASQPVAEDRVASAAPLCYVEPRPRVFYRLAYLAGALVDGLDHREMLGGSAGPLGLQALAGDLLDLADRLTRLGDIAVKELNGAPLDQSDCALVIAPLGGIEARQFRSQLLAAPLDTPPMPLVSTITSIDEQSLQVGVGRVNRIYVLAPMEGEVYIVQGGVYSYYEFLWPSQKEMNDEIWRQMLVQGLPAPPTWTANYLLSGGTPVDALVFRVGDVYRLTLAGGQGGLRLTPDLNARYLHRPRPGELLTILEGPVQADGYTWWKFQATAADGQLVEGWGVENEDWYERAW